MERTVKSDTDRNELFGTLALQTEFVSREQMQAALIVSAKQGDRAVDEILVEEEVLSEEICTLIKALADQRLSMSDDIARLRVQSMDATCSIVERSQPIADTESGASTVVSNSQTPTCDRANLRSVGRYVVVRHLAKGGMGDVSVALDTELDREVALKEIQQRYVSDESRRSRFLLEATVTGKLEHPGIVPVYSVGQSIDGRPFYVMRLIEGKSLHAAIEEFHQDTRQSGKPTIEFRQLLGRFKDACFAVEYAHSRGVLHRDIKPENIMVGNYGETLVVDWGLAKVVGRLEQHQHEGKRISVDDTIAGHLPTQAGSAIGTPVFMSPEQAEGKHHELTSSTDVYSLGATLYMLLTGTTPFSVATSGNIEVLLNQVRSGDFRKPRDLKSSLPAPLESICLKAMARDPQDRYQSCREFAEDIERYLGDEPIDSHRDTMFDMASRQMRRDPGSTIMVSILITFVVQYVFLSALKNMFPAVRDEIIARLDLFVGPGKFGFAVGACAGAVRCIYRRYFAESPSTAAVGITMLSFALTFSILSVILSIGLDEFRDWIEKVFGQGSGMAETW